MTEEKKYILSMRDVRAINDLVMPFDIWEFLQGREYHEHVVPIANINIDMDELLDRIAAEYCEVCPNCGTTMDFVRKDEVACSLFSKKENE